MKCFHHSDYDGYCSAAIVKKKYPHCSTFYINYKDKFPHHLIEKDEEIFIVDFSMEKAEDWKKLIERTSNIVWIDHHKTSIEKANENGYSYLNGLRKDDYPAGCELTWEYIYNSPNIPLAVHFISLYDCWKHEDREEVVGFFFGLKLCDIEPGSEFWNKVLNVSSNANRVVFEVAKKGKDIIEVRKKEAIEVLDNYGFETEFEGLKLLVLNKPKIGSKYFESADASNYDAFACFGYDGFVFDVSLYHAGNKEIDLSAYAKKYGGGGHRGACGFTTKEIPFKGIKRYVAKQ